MDLKETQDPGSPGRPRFKHQNLNNSQFVKCVLLLL